MSDSTQPLNPRMIVHPAGPGGFFKGFGKFDGVLCFGIIGIFASTALGGQRIRSSGEIVEFGLGDSVFPHLVEADGDGLAGEGLEGLCFEGINAVAGPYPNGQVRVVVDAGAGSDKIVHIVHGWLVDRPTVGPGRKGFGRTVLCSEWGDGSDDFLLE